jgi:hypothetical protein
MEPSQRSGKIKDGEETEKKCGKKKKEGICSAHFGNFSGAV